MLRCCVSCTSDCHNAQPTKSNLSEDGQETPAEINIGPLLDAESPRGKGVREGTIDSSSSQLSYFDRELEELEQLRKGVAGFVSVNDKKPYLFRSGATYLGQWYDNKRHGYGKQTWPDGSIYQGQWQENCAVGRGRFVHHDGDIYIGQWVQSMASGNGTFYHRGGSTIYKGQWSSDLQDGYGVESWSEGATFEGSFRNGQKEGWGCYHWVDGSVYEGTWLDNVIHGTGAYFGEDGRKSFHGEWRESVIHGVGHYQWCKGREYCGQYKNDRKYGFGIFRWPDGRKYEGFWKDGKQYGRGRYTSKEGMVIELEESHRDEPKEFELNWTSENQVTNHPWADRGGTAQDEQGVR